MNSRLEPAVARKEGSPPAGQVGSGAVDLVGQLGLDLEDVLTTAIEHAMTCDQGAAVVHVRQLALVIDPRGDEVYRVVFRLAPKGAPIPGRMTHAEGGNWDLKPDTEGNLLRVAERRWRGRFSCGSDHGEFARRSSTSAAAPRAAMQPME